jgi:hypothetical protein
VCKNSPWVGEEVVVVTPEGTARSHVMSPYLLPPGVATKYQTVISDVATTGNSGSGVFDELSKCLLGIISGVIQQKVIRQENADTVRGIRDVAKYFVASPTIADFITPDIHF